MGRNVPSDWTPDRPHVDPNRELFAQHLARGSVSASRAYALVWGVTNPSTAKANAHRTRHEPAMAARVTAIREELARGNTGEPEVITEGSIRALMTEATAAFQAALAEGERVQASPALLSALRRAATVHLGRVQRLQSRRMPETVGDTGADPVRAALDRLHVCECVGTDVELGSAS